MLPQSVWLTRRLRLVVLPCALGAHALVAQQGAGLRGLVSDKSTGRPVAGAQIAIVGENLRTFTDSSGRFALAGLPAGETHLTVRAAGFPQRRVAVNLVAAGTIERAIELDSTAATRMAEAQALPEVSVTAPATRANYRLVDFERRRQLGRGQFLTESEIVKSGAYNVADAVKNMRGVVYDCGGGAGCYIHMARAPMRCLPEFIVDGHEMNDFGPHTPIRDIIGLELYTGPTEVPGEYAGRFAGCGVIVIWTRSGPTPKSQ